MSDLTAAALHVDGLSFTYAGAKSHVLREVSFEVESGAFALLVGSTGSGKSTLLSLVKPQVAPAGERRGTLSVFGTPVEDLSDAESAQTVGYVLQNPDNQLVCDSVLHELAFGLENLDMSQDGMRRRVAETGYFFAMDDWLHENVNDLPGGRKQLLALASVLAMRPRLLLLDEPTAQLDPIATRTFLHALFRANRELGCTVVVATHEPWLMVDYATCAFTLEDGAVTPVGDMDSLRRREPLLLDEPRPSYARPPATQDGHALEVDIARAWFRYDRAGSWVLRNLDLRVSQGAVHALVGGNGSGKSTLLGIMAGTQRLYRGSLALGSQARALLPQDPCALFATKTVRDELLEWARPAGYDAEAADAMLKRLGLVSQAGLHPYDLSGGQRQLLALGKLLLVHPKLLLLDEPTKGLDLHARRLLARIILEERAAGATVVLASHDLDFVEQVADVVSMVFDGEIACTQAVDAFFRDNFLFRT